MHGGCQPAICRLQSCSLYPFFPCKMAAVLQRVTTVLLEADFQSRSRCQRCPPGVKFHTHTAFSSGKFTPSRRAGLYMSGYSWLTPACEGRAPSSTKFRFGEGMIRGDWGRSFSTKSQCVQPLSPLNIILSRFYRNSVF